MAAKAWRCALCHLTAPDVARSKRKRDLCDLCYDSLEARGLAWCSRCKRRAAISEIVQSDKNGRCKACIRALKAIWRERNGYEYDRKIARQYRARNVERIRAYERSPEARAKHAIRMRRWRENNPERDKAAKRAYYERNRDKRAAAYRAWKATRPGYDRLAYQRRKLRILQSWRRAA